MLWILTEKGGYFFAKTENINYGLEENKVNAISQISISRSRKTSAYNCKLLKSLFYIFVEQILFVTLIPI